MVKTGQTINLLDVALLGLMAATPPFFNAVISIFILVGPRSLQAFNITVMIDG